MMEDPSSIGFCAHLLFCAKNLERIGDHATNIAPDHGRHALRRPPES
jgi:phosphate uptake regulator